MTTRLNTTCAENMFRYIALLLGFLLLTACEKQGTPERHLIPAAYEGVVITIYGQQGFAELSMKDGYRVYEYPADGILITSSKPDYGSASEETLDVLQDGTYRKISYGNIAGRPEDRREHFAVSGSRDGGVQPKIEYYFKVIGSFKYWNSIDAKEYDRKKDEAIRKLKKLLATH